MTLTSYEKTQLAFFICQSSEYQKQLLQEALYGSTSGPLIIAYRWVMANT